MWILSPVSACFWRSSGKEGEEMNNFALRFSPIALIVIALLFPLHFIYDEDPAVSAQAAIQLIGEQKPHSR